MNLSVDRNVCGKVGSIEGVQSGPPRMLLANFYLISHARNSSLSSPQFPGEREKRMRMV